MNDYKYYIINLDGEHRKTPMTWEGLLKTLENLKWDIINNEDDHTLNISCKNKSGGYGYRESKEDTISSLLLEKIEIYEEYTDSVNFDIEDIKRITEIDRKLMERVNE